MAEIFLARQQDIHGFQKSLVVKRILPQYAEDEEFVQMFLAEARLAAKLVHPNIAQVYDIGEEGGYCFFAMEYVHGRDLRALIRKMVKSNAGRLSLDHVINIAIHTLAGLHCAHEQKSNNGKPLGIVHRDVSPSNVLVTFSGGVKLLDFGVAKVADSRNSTAVGILKGKIPYMSPEQCRGDRSLDRRSDIFSLGTVLWELSTFSRLFKCETELATITRIAHQPAPRPSTKVEDYPEGLEQIVMKALALDRNERYNTAEEMQLDLEDFAREHRLAVSPIKLGKFMRDLFEDDLEEEARAEAESREATESRLELVASGDEEEATAAYTPSGVDAASGLATARGVAAAATEGAGGTAVGNPQAAAQSGTQPLGEWNAPSSLDPSKLGHEPSGVDERDLATRPIAPVADELELGLESESFEQPKKNWVLLAGGIIGAFIIAGVSIGIAVGKNGGEADKQQEPVAVASDDVDEPPTEPTEPVEADAPDEPTEPPADPDAAQVVDPFAATGDDDPDQPPEGSETGGDEAEGDQLEQPEPPEKKKKKPSSTKKKKKKKKTTKPPADDTKTKKKKPDTGFDKNGLSPPP